MKIEIKKMGINGEGIGYDHKIPVFIKGALKGEVVDARITKDYGRYKTGKVIKFYQRSAFRKKEDCTYLSNCGGCTLRHASYEHQLEVKKEILEESLLKYAELELPFEVEGSVGNNGYRNSVKLPFATIQGRLCTGLYEEESNRFLKVENCLNHEPVLEKVRKEILKILNKYHCLSFDKSDRKGMRYLYMRTIDGRIQCCLVTGNDVLNEKMVDEIFALPEIVSLYQSIHTSKGIDIFGKQMLHLRGEKYLNFRFEDLKLRLSIRSFFQLNTAQAKKLYAYVKSQIKKDQGLIVEAYSGIGAMSLLMHDKAKKVVGIESIKDAVLNANFNAKANHFENVSFLCGDAAEVMYRNFRHQKIDTLIVDPPRSGLDDNMLETMLRAKISNIIYVSCNGATLAKNLAVLSKRYRVDSIKAFDLFPNTQHVECVALLQRRK